MVLSVGGGEHRLFHTAEEAFAQRLVGLERGQQLLAPVVGGRVGQQFIAVVHHRALEMLAVQAQPAHQRVDGNQHRPSDIIGVDLVAGHQQHCRARVRIGQAAAHQLIHAQQPIRGRMVRFATGAVQHAVEPRLDDEARPRGAVVQQVWRPVGDAPLLLALVEQKVVLDQAVAGQRCIGRETDEVQHRMMAKPQPLAGLAFESNAPLLAGLGAFKDQRQLEHA